MCPLPNQPWTTSLPGAQDTVGVEQPDLTNDSSPGANDGHRVLVEHLHALRDKLQYVTETVGDTNSLPANSLKDKVKKDNLVAVADPTVNDDNTAGYSARSIWINTSTPAGFICLDASTGAAVWQQVGASVPTDLLSRTTGTTALYIDASSGNDSSDGSSGNPVQTWSRLQELINHLDLHTVTIYATGTFSSSVHFDLGHVSNAITVSIEGQGTTVLDGPRTADIHSASTIGVSGVGWTTNAFVYKFVEILSGTYSGYALPILSNTSDTITFPRPLAGDVGAVQFRVVEPASGFSSDVTISSVSSDMDSGITIQNFKVDSDFVLNGGVFNLLSISGDPSTSYIKSDGANKISFSTYSGTSQPVASNHIEFNYVSSARLANTICGATNGALNTWKVGFLELKSLTAVYGASLSNTAFGVTGQFYVKGSRATVSDCSVSMYGSSIWDLSDISDAALVLKRTRIDLGSGGPTLSGSGNASYGLFITDNSFVIIDSSASVTLTGTSGDISFNGTSEASTWASVTSGTPAIHVGENCLVKRSTDATPDSSGGTDPSAAHKTTSDVDYYFDSVSGNDGNDGLSAGNPVQTVSRLLEIIPDILEHNVFINIVGTLDASSTHFKKIINEGGYIRFDGGSGRTTVYGPYTASASDSSSVTVSSPTWTENQLVGYQVQTVNGPSSGKYRTVYKNTTTRIYFNRGTMDIGVGNTFNIVQPETLLKGKFIFPGRNSDEYVIRLHRLKIDSFTCISPMAMAIGSCMLTSFCSVIGSSLINVIPSYLDPTTKSSQLDYIYAGGRSCSLAISLTAQLELACLNMKGGDLNIFGSGSGKPPSSSNAIGASTLSSHICDGAITIRDSNLGLLGTVLITGNLGTNLGGLNTINSVIENVATSGTLEITNTDYGLYADGSNVFIRTLTGTGNAYFGAYLKASRLLIDTSYVPTITGGTGYITIDGTTEATTWVAVNSVAFSNAAENVLIRREDQLASSPGGSSPLTTKGDLYTYDTGDARLGVGGDGQILIADSSEATGLKWALKNNLTATTDPTVNDDSSAGYGPLSCWVNLTSDKAFVCVDDSVGAAVWKETTQSGGASVPLILNPDNTQAIIATSSNGLDTGDYGLIEAHMTQDANDQPAHYIEHEFAGNTGSAIEVIGSHSSGIQLGASARGYNVSMEQRTDTDEIWYAVGSNTGRMIKKIGAAAWADEAHGSDITTFHAIHGSGLDNIWAIGTGGSGTRVLKNIDGTGWVVDSTFTYNGVGTNPLNIVVISKTEVYVLLTISSTNHVLVFNGSSWSNYTSGTNYYIGSLAVTGSNLIYKANPYYYSTNGGANWNSGALPDSAYGPRFIVDPLNPTKFLAAAIISGSEFRIYRGTHGDWGSAIATNAAATLYSPDAIYQHMWVAPNGDIFIMCNHGGMSLAKYDGSWSYLASGFSSLGSGIFGISTDNVRFVGSNGSVNHWNGLTVTNEATPYTGLEWRSFFGVGPSEENKGIFEGYKASFQSPATSYTKSVAFKAGNNADHALEADSGNVKLESGDVNLKALSAAPTGESGRGKFYTKDVSGTVQAFFVDSDDNEIQLTAGGETNVPSFNEDEFSTNGTETPGETVSFALDETPHTATNTPSGYDILVFRNGVKMRYAASPATYNQYFYDSGNNEIDVLASGSADEYEVVYSS